MTGTISVTRHKQWIILTNVYERFMKRDYMKQRNFCSLSLLHGVLVSSADTKQIALCTAQAHIILLPSNDQLDRTEGRKSLY